MRGFDLVRIMTPSSEAVTLKLTQKPYTYLQFTLNSYSLQYTVNSLQFTAYRLHVYVYMEHACKQVEGPLGGLQFSINEHANRLQLTGPLISYVFWA